MCGLFGTYHDASFDDQQRNVVMSMLQVGVLRGSHGTGLVSVKKDLTMSYIKVGGPPSELYAAEGFREFIEPALKDGRIMFGHHRHATKGEINDTNAHPFQHGNITLMHNGTLTEGIEVKAGEVDSERLCKLVSDVGAVEAFKTVRGAYACLWWDDGDKKLRMIKNGQRPLAVAKFRGNIYWASERLMLDWILDRSYYGGQDVAQYYQLENDQLYVFEKGELRKEEAITKKALYTSYLPATSHGGNVVNSVTSVGRRWLAGNKENKDLFADFELLTEDIVQRRGRESVIRYQGLTDKYENIFIDLKDPLDQGWDKKQWHGKLKNGHRVNSAGWIDNALPHTEIFYEVEPETLIEYIDDDINGKDMETSIVRTKDNYGIPLRAASLFCRNGCVTCQDKSMFIKDVGRMAAFTGSDEKIRGLFCVACTASFPSLKDKQQVKTVQ